MYPLWQRQPESTHCVHIDWVSRSEPQVTTLVSIEHPEFSTLQTTLQPYTLPSLNEQLGTHAESLLCTE